jgi:transposase
MKEPLPVELTTEEMDALLERLSGILAAGDYEIIAGMVATLKTLKQAVDEKGLSIRRLLRMIFGDKTETAKNILPEPVPGGEPFPPISNNSQEHATPNEPEEKTKAPGHGRNGADDYTGAVKIKLSHSTLKIGDVCPKCSRGKVYLMDNRGSLVRITASPPIQASVYEWDKLRCNLCGGVFNPELPAGIGPEKYDAPAGAMVALLKYGSGFPFYRLQYFQDSLGMPLAASTQWEIVEKVADRILPAYLELIRQAAQGDIIYNDDTTVKILDLMAENAAEDAPARKGMFTSGLVSTLGEIKIGLFITGRNHAGENLSDVLAQRAKALPPPIQMCDALSRNLPQELETILANCLTHARRNFADLAEIFPPECGYVIKILGEIYRNDSEAKAHDLSPIQRLELHQRESSPWMEELHTWLNQQFEEKTVEPNSGLGKAISYMLKHWEALTLFLRVPGAPLDNNICERALKMVILHRKNSLFYKTEHGAYIGDLFMSLIHTCRLSKINPFNYLTTLQKYSAHLRQNPHLWLPWNYQTTLAALPP